MFYSIALIAYALDNIFGEFEKLKFLKHPIIFMGDYINWFKKKYYEDSILRGGILTVSLIVIVYIITSFLASFDNILFQGFLASFTLASKMLYDSVEDVITSRNLEVKKEKIAMLVSRDTSTMTNSDVNKAAVETYAENLSDGVIAPLFYLLCFGIVGAFIYKAINTLDSMIGYRNEKYENFGKIAAILDDIVNYVPARITAVLIAILFMSKKALTQFYKYGSKHESPNAGLPIASMALSLDLKLGGPTSYFGKIKDKAFFGIGKENIENSDVLKTLSLKYRLDIFIIIVLILGVL
ncbi:adenosylcobinamide-phosphate synthase CbiB [Poseidonibacter antarcticus]|uniref:adenosylcobinamide-phosphate synthase CbiB n=1 Tax=Poseidonibacter antarcticus TaxID=2478538 RepID=UPI000EF519D2|nr:adenosylcobinamide-phosphate synthase CbiB [Poseidonibacter antarcticus]